MKYPLTLLALLTLLFSDMAGAVLAGEADATTKPSKPAITEIVSGAEFSEGAVVRGPKTARRMALVFTGHEYAEGARRFSMRWPHRGRRPRSF